jgi:hypothetical protein
MNLGSFKFIHVVRIDASPAVERIVERIAQPGADLAAQWEAFMATNRALLDALRAGVERTETLKAEVARLQREKAEHEEQDRLRAEEEAEEDRLETEEDETARIEREEHAAAVARWEQERAFAEGRIRELEDAIAGGDILTPEEKAEMEELVARLNAPDGEPPAPPAPEPPAPVE